jgi:small-conductance mechanosensitive channel
MTDLVTTIQENLRDFVASTVLLLPGLIIAVVVIWATSISVRVVKRVATRAGEHMIQSPSLRSLAIQASVVGTWILGVLLASVILFPDLRLGDLIGFLGLGSVAVGFAFQDIFKNFLAGVLLLLNEPFRLQDQIIVSDYEGTVEDISIRSTQIRTYQGERVVIPNSVVFTNPVHVLTDQVYRRTDLAIGVDYNTPLPLAVDTLLTAVKTVEGVFPQPDPEVDIVGFGNSSIDLVVRYWTRPQQRFVRQTVTRVMIALKQACDQADIVIPYPIRTVYNYDQRLFSDYIPKAETPS